MKPQKPRQYRWRCVLCEAWDMCASPLLALAGFENHYQLKHRERP